MTREEEKGWRTQGLEESWMAKEQHKGCRTARLKERRMTKEEGMTGGLEELRKSG